MHRLMIMWDAIFILAALASPFILLALAAGAAGPIVKIKIRLGLIALVVLLTSTALILRDLVTESRAQRTHKGA